MRKIKNIHIIVGVTTLILLITYSLIALWTRYQATHKPVVLTNPDITENNPTTSPTESVVVGDDYNIDPELPRQIILPTIGTTGYIQKVGMDKDYTVGAPNNIFLAGWYTKSVLPGQDGLSIIDGHVSGKYVDGVFKNLKLLKIGEEFQIEFGDKSLKSFRVVDSMQIPATDSSKILLQKRNDIPKQLNLITCGGAFDKSTNKYVDRQLIISEAI